MSFSPLGGILPFLTSLPYTGVGDAARAVNPILSQGVTLAAEDAYVLARAVKREEGRRGGVVRAFR